MDNIRCLVRLPTICPTGPSQKGRRPLVILYLFTVDCSAVELSDIESSTLNDWVELDRKQLFTEGIVPSVLAAARRHAARSTAVAAWTVGCQQFDV